ncbi:MAG: hypothetical protein ABI411_20060 [Tahibacter sp.]
MNNVIKKLMRTLCAMLALSASTVPLHAAAIGPNYPKACLDSISPYRWVSTGPILASDSVSLPYLSTTGSATPPVPAHRVAQFVVTRIPCGGGKSALLLGIYDDISYTLIPPPALLYPVLSAIQGGNVSTLIAHFPGYDHRLTSLINVGDLFHGSPDPLEISSGVVDLNAAFDLVVQDPFLPGNRRVISVPAYEPTPATYPDEYGPRPISGRYAGNYYDPARAGEGIIVEVGDMPLPQFDQHFLQFSWFTYDNEGKPFWISGGANFTDGDKHLHMPAIYRGGGGFAGAQAADSAPHWGTVDIEFNDCNSVHLSYSADPGAPKNVPGGAGELRWQRLTGISGHACN